jgi:hypothetical protein
MNCLNWEQLQNVSNNMLAKTLLLYLIVESIHYLVTVI